MASGYDKSDSGSISMDYGFFSLRLQSCKTWSPRDRMYIEFVSLEDKFKCPICWYVLQSPVQSVCGHLYCLDCVELKVEDDPSGISCPVDKGCAKILRETLFPDFSVLREIQYLKVFCVYKGLGCAVIISWVELQKHEDKCEFKALGHECHLKPFGCTFSGTVEDLEQHRRRGLDEHVEYVAKFLNEKGDDLNNISIEIHELRREHTGLEKTLSNLAKQFSEHDRKLTPLENQMARISQMSEKVDKKILVLEQKYPTQKASVQQVGILDHELAQLKGRLRHIEDTVTKLERRPGSYLPANAGRANTEVIRKLTSHEAHLRKNEPRISEIELKLNISELITLDGHMVWKIDKYHSRKLEAKGSESVSLESVPFLTGCYGYKLSARVYLNGDGPGRGTHLSFYIQLLRGDYDDLLKWPFQQKLTLMLMSQEPGKDNLVDSFKASPFTNSFKRPRTESNRATGCPLFARHSVVETRRFLKDDTIFLKAEVDISSL